MVVNFFPGKAFIELVQYIFTIPGVTSSLVNAYVRILQKDSLVYKGSEEESTIIQMPTNFRRILRLLELLTLLQGLLPEEIAVRENWILRLIRKISTSHSLSAHVNISTLHLFTYVVCGFICMLVCLVVLHLVNYYVYCCTWCSDFTKTI